MAEDSLSSSEEENCRKKRCHDRYDSSESSDSGVAVHCGDCGSSNSDITEPCSPLSETGSVEEMPPTQSSPAWLWGPHPPKQGKITEYFKSKTKKVPPPNSVGGATIVSQTAKFISKFLHSTPDLQESFRFKQVVVSDVDKSVGVQQEHQHQVDSGVESSPGKKEDEEDRVVGVERGGVVGETEAEERTIRFPARTGWKGHYVSDVICRWADCEAKFTTTTALIEHLQIKHVNSQTLGEYYVCKWVECKVYDRKSCSRTWLERHVLSHGGNKPYRCIVDGCGHRFTSQTLLQRHVNSHFAETNVQNGSRKSCESTNKLIRRNGKKLRYRRHPFSARVYDYFDAGIMEGLQHNLIKLTERRTLGQFDNTPGHTLTLHSKVLGRRLDKDGQTKVLLRWFPVNVVSDEWVDEGSVRSTREVSMRTLPESSKDFLYSLLCSTPSSASSSSSSTTSSSSASSNSSSSSSPPPVS